MRSIRQSTKCDNTSQKVKYILMASASLITQPHMSRLDAYISKLQSSGRRIPAKSEVASSLFGAWLKQSTRSSSPLLKRAYILYITDPKRRFKSPLDYLKEHIEASQSVKTVEAQSNQLQTGLSAERFFASQPLWAVRPLRIEAFKEVDYSKESQPFSQKKSCSLNLNERETQAAADHIVEMRSSIEFDKKAPPTTKGAKEVLLPISEETNWESLTPSAPKSPSIDERIFLENNLARRVGQQWNTSGLLPDTLAQQKAVAYELHNKFTASMSQLDKATLDNAPEEANLRVKNLFADNFGVRNAFSLDCIQFASERDYAEPALRPGRLGENIPNPLATERTIAAEEKEPEWRSSAVTEFEEGLTRNGPPPPPPPPFLPNGGQTTSQIETAELIAVQQNSSPQQVMAPATSPVQSLQSELSDVLSTRRSSAVSSGTRAYSEVISPTPGRSPMSSTKQTYRSLFTSGWRDVVDNRVSAVNRYLAKRSADSAFNIMQVLMGLRSAADLRSESEKRLVEEVGKDAAADMRRFKQCERTTFWMELEEAILAKMESKGADLSATVAVLPDIPKQFEILGHLVCEVDVITAGSPELRKSLVEGLSNLLFEDKPAEKVVDLYCNFTGPENDEEFKRLKSMFALFILTHRDRQLIESNCEDLVALYLDKSKNYRALPPQRQSILTGICEGSAGSMFEKIANSLAGEWLS